MVIVATLESKNTAITATLETKVGDTITFGQGEGTFGENEGTFANPEVGAALEAKTTAITASLEAKL